jgi:hypothetical protein
MTLNSSLLLGGWERQLQLFAKLVTVAKNREKKNIFDPTDCRARFSLSSGPIHLIPDMFKRG